MAAAVSIYLAFNLGASSARGWGVAMSTDTAFALGVLALLGRRLPDRLRAFILTVAVDDDLLALVIAGMLAEVIGEALDARLEQCHPGRRSEHRVHESRAQAQRAKLATP